MLYQINTCFSGLNVDEELVRLTRKLSKPFSYTSANSQNYIWNGFNSFTDRAGFKPIIHIIDQTVFLDLRIAFLIDRI